MLAHESFGKCKKKLTICEPADFGCAEIQIEDIGGF